jgi:hypothetical protein
VLFFSYVATLRHILTARLMLQVFSWLPSLSTDDGKGNKREETRQSMLTPSCVWQARTYEEAVLACLNWEMLVVQKISTP